MEGQKQELEEGRRSLHLSAKKTKVKVLWKRKRGGKRKGLFYFTSKEERKANFSQLSFWDRQKGGGLHSFKKGKKTPKETTKRDHLRVLFWGNKRRACQRTEERVDKEGSVNSFGLSQRGDLPRKEGKGERGEDPFLPQKKEGTLSTPRGKAARNRRKEGSSSEKKGGEHHFSEKRDEGREEGKGSSSFPWERKICSSLRKRKA